MATKLKRISKLQCSKWLAANAQIKPWDSGLGDVIDTWYSNIDGSFICFANNVEDIRWMLKKGITEQLQSSRPEDPRTACIGFNPELQKWYGWSHRAVYGFGIGQTVKKGDCGYKEIKGEWTAETLDDAKQMAIDFAHSVS